MIGMLLKYFYETVENYTGQCSYNGGIICGNHLIKMKYVCKLTTVIQSEFETNQEC